MGLAFRIPTAQRTPLLGEEESLLYSAYNKNIRSGAKKGRVLDMPQPLGSGVTSFLVRESANDRLTGLRIAWSKREVSLGRDTLSISVLVSMNASLERVAF
jgi:hypothetical protein